MFSSLLQAVEFKIPKADTDEDIILGRPDIQSDYLTKDTWGIVLHYCRSYVQCIICSWHFAYEIHTHDSDSVLRVGINYQHTHLPAIMYDKRVICDFHYYKDGCFEIINMDKKLYAVASRIPE